MPSATRSRGSSGRDQRDRYRLDGDQHITDFTVGRDSADDASAALTMFPILVLLLAGAVVLVQQAAVGTQALARAARA